MLTLKRGHLASWNVRLDRPNTRAAGSTVLAFRPIAAVTNRSSLGQLGIAGPSHSTTVEADIIPLRSRRLASPTRSAALPPSPAVIKYAGAQSGGPWDYVASEDDYRHRTIANLAAVAWVGTLMTAGYFVFSRLMGLS
jgi:hypothetical protein